MGFRLTPRSMTLDDLELLAVRIFLEFRAISYIWKATTAKRMEIDLYRLRQNCSPLNVLFIDVQISLILLGVPPLGDYNYITPRRAGLSATAGLSCLASYIIQQLHYSIVDVATSQPNRFCEKMAFYRFLFLTVRDRGVSVSYVIVMPYTHSTKING